MKKRIMLIVTIMILVTTVIIIKSNPSKEIYINENTIEKYDNKEIAIYKEVKGKYVYDDKMPSKNDGYVVNASKTVCEGSTKIRWDNDSWSAKISNFSGGTIKCYVYFDKIANPDITIKTTLNGVASETFPDKSSGYIPTNINCTNGVIGTFDYENWGLKVKTSRETVCTINFENKASKTFSEYLKEKTCTNGANEKCLVNENGLRFEGKNPNNYVLYNNELWRVIGVFNVDTENNGKQDLVKIIRAKLIGDMALDANNMNTWATSTLKEVLNNAYLNKSTAECYYGISDDLSVKITKPCGFENKGLNETSRNMIESVSWNVGGTLTSKTDVNTMYTAEKNIVWTGKVGLMSVSDVGYSVLASSCARTTSLYEYKKSACAGSSWLYSDSKQRTINAFDGTTNKMFYFHNTGYITSGDAIEGYGVKPSVYLKSTVKVIGGSGTYESPYIIAN